MTVTPIRAARLATARHRIAELLADRCTFPDEAARDVIDALLDLGWNYPGAHLDDPIPQPASSSDGHRKALIAGVRTVIDTNRRNRTTVEKEGL